MPTHGTFDVETSLAKGIIFRKIGLANGAILKLWAAHHCPKFKQMIDFFLIILSALGQEPSFLPRR